MKNFYHSSHFAMNTRLDIILWGCEESYYAQVDNKIHTTIKALELIYSRFDNKSELYKLNDTAYNNYTKLSNTLLKSINQCLEYSVKTTGYFNIGFLNNQGMELHDLIEVRSHSNTIKYLYPNVKLDFGGIGKGIALKHIELILNAYNIENAIISFGESSVLTRGKHPHGSYWPFSFQDQHNFGESLKLNNHMVSISGLHNNTPHIINPESGKLVSDSRAVCIVNNDPIAAEVLSTALIAAPQNLHQQIIKSFTQEKVLYSKS
ncbi:FAD:protein FMN transferase [Plebeiibacterium marinum]|uniref:FAD:protein FMN transferase n=1 Tax=Plebeiibacterium marinum TaxID=2992111 RepID=A0AAE3MEQ0_9BACT|nr:FAD:protein FMN transferase [Plebeiobacterium marinum]MCW3806159.1 FAD:protein FMN transferase [Plebeiobacterium marinum]